MEVSSFLAHHLDADVGARLAVAMKALNPGIDQDIDKILDIAKTKNARVVEDFFPDFPDAELKDTALAIISAWYTGVVVDAPNAEVFAYELALIYQPSSDVMTIPSYAISGPNGWNACACPSPERHADVLTREEHHEADNEGDLKGPVPWQARSASRLPWGCRSDYGCNPFGGCWRCWRDDRGKHLP
jgi:Membrane bound FAD containing D-sorbitol dehydrogenase